MVPRCGGLPVESSSWRSGSGRRYLLVALLVLAAVAPGGVLAQPVLENLRARVARGEAEAANTLGNMYAFGQGVGQDFAEATRLYQLAADGGLPVANFNLGLMYETGRGVAPDTGAAFRFYFKAAEKGVAAAQFNVGNMYANGIGVPKDDFEALLWFRQAADQGLAEAQYNLALAYEHGRGVRLDEAAARRWYRLAVTQGNPRAQYNLALMLEEGRGGDPGPEEALTLYRAAAAQGFAAAQNNLGLMLAAGRVGPPNLVEAYKWLSLAVENGMSPEARDLVAKQLSSEQLAQANSSLARARDLQGALGGRPAESTPVGNDHATASNSVPVPPVAGSAAAAQPLTAEGSVQSAAAAAPAAEVSLQQMALDDPRIARLIFDNRRLSQESLRANLRLLQVSSQLRTLQDRERLNAVLMAPPPPAEPSPEQAKRIEIMRRTIVKLAEENRRLHASQAELSRLRTEIERLHTQSFPGKP
jgi:TPR repeat protein